METQLRDSLRGYFQTEFAQLIHDKLESGHRLANFNVNPFVSAALASGVFGELTSGNIAKALLYPRVLGTSISTTFGDMMQKLCVEYLGARASSTPGMDLEFTDRTNNTSIILQLKAGPNTINSPDVEPILEKMRSAYRLLHQNRTREMPTFAIGIIYGEITQISSSYRKISNSSVGAQDRVQMFVGADYWKRLTGDETFYREMIKIFIELFEQVDYSTLLETDLSSLQQEIEAKYFTEGDFDLDKI